MPRSDVPQKSLSLAIYTPASMAMLRKVMAKAKGVAFRQKNVWKISRIKFKLRHAVALVIPILLRLLALVRVRMRMRMGEHEIARHFASWRVDHKRRGRQPDILHVLVEPVG